MTSQIWIGDCRETLRLLPRQSVHTCVTSPPYFGLRDYGHGEQIGLEPTPDEFVAAMVEVFREVRDVLRDDGTLWLNLGDSYNANGRKGHGTRQGHKQGTNRASAADQDFVRPTAPGLKEKELLGIPWRVAFALQADGWYLRQDIIWHKPNPMPESVRDRCTKAHEYIFLLSKRPSYYFDHEAIKEPSAAPEASAARYKSAFGGAKNKELLDTDQVHTRPIGMREFDGKRNKRDVWTVATRPYKGAHFATFPPALIEPCVLAGAPVGGTVLDPFGGAGTTGLVAEQHGRHSVLCELNPEYAAMAAARIGPMAVVL